MGWEAAVLKSWVESRFGLLTRNHKGFLSTISIPLRINVQVNLEIIF